MDGGAWWVAVHVKQLIALTATLPTLGTCQTGQGVQVGQAGAGMAEDTGGEGRYPQRSDSLTPKRKEKYIYTRNMLCFWELVRGTRMCGEDPLEKEMATYSSILAWRSPWTEKPGGL